MMTTEKKKEIIAAYGRTPDDLIEGTLSMKKIFLKKVRK